jgi:choline dehydrogenase
MFSVRLSLKICCFQILFEGRKAVGVQMIQDGKVKTARADKEVLLCAGTIGSTKLLLLSGLGPKAHLGALKVWTTKQSC